MAETQAHVRSQPIPDDPLPNHSRYQTVRYLNRGGHGFIILGKDRQTNQQVALKFLPRTTATTKYVEREIVNQFKLRYPHVIALEEIFLTGEYLVLVMEYADKGDLHAYVMSMGTGLPEKHAQNLFQQIMLAVDFCHRMGVVNRDIKLENILMVGNLIKLADFGFSKDDGHSAPSSRVGTLQYIAPEVVTNTEGSTYDGKKADMWSCGVVLYALLSSRYPFHRRHDSALGQQKQMNTVIKRILAADYPPITNVSPQCQNLLTGLLTVDPAKRLSMEDVFRHPWYLEGLNPSVLHFNDRVIDELRINPPINETVIEQVRKLLADARVSPGTKDGVSPSCSEDTMSTRTEEFE